MPNLTQRPPRVGAPVRPTTAPPPAPDVGSGVPRHRRLPWPASPSSPRPASTRRTGPASTSARCSASTSTTRRRTCCSPRSRRAPGSRTRTGPTPTPSPSSATRSSTSTWTNARRARRATSRTCAPSAPSTRTKTYLTAALAGSTTRPTRTPGTTTPSSSSSVATSSPTDRPVGADSGGRRPARGGLVELPVDDLPPGLVDPTLHRRPECRHHGPGPQVALAVQSGRDLGPLLRRLPGLDEGLPHVLLEQGHERRGQSIARRRDLRGDVQHRPQRDAVSHELAADIEQRRDRRQEPVLGGDE